MPDYRLTFNGDMVGRLSVPEAFAQVIASTILSDGRFELSAGFEKANNSPRLLEFILSPLSQKQKNADPAAGSDGSRSEGDRVRASDSPTGNTQEPVAWYVGVNGWEYVSLLREAAESAGGSHVKPLYLHPTLTDEEREAVTGMACYFDTRGNIQMQAWGSLLRILLERLT